MLLPQNGHSKILSLTHSQQFSIKITVANNIYTYFLKCHFQTSATEKQENLWLSYVFSGFLYSTANASKKLYWKS